MTAAPSAPVTASEATKAPLIPKLVITVAMLVTGAAGLVYEYLLSTTSSYLIGDSIRQFSITIGLMLFMMGVAGAVQGRINDRHLVVKFVAAELALCVIGAFAPIATYAAYAKWPDDFKLVQYAFIIAIGFLIGLEIPLALRINEQFSRKLRHNIAYVAAADYVGSAVGATVWVVLLQSHIQLLEMGFLVASVNLFVAVLFFGYFWRQGMIAWRPAKPAGMAALAATALALVLGFGHTGAWANAVDQDLYEDPIAFQQRTAYQQIVLTHREHPEDIRLYLNGNLQFSSQDEAIYHELLVHPVMALAPSHSHVLILGGGDGLAMREVLKYPDVTSVTLVDLDPGMIELAKTNPLLTRLNGGSLSDARVQAEVSPGVIDTGRHTPVNIDTGVDTQIHGHSVPVTRTVATVNVFTIDADQFLRERAGRWDVVIVDLPDPSSVELAKLYSQQFYAKIKQALTADGLMVVQSGSPYHARAAFVCIRKTITAAGFQTLPYHENVPSFGDWGWVMGWKNGESPEALGRRIDSLQGFAVPTRYLDGANTWRRTLSFGRGWLDDRFVDVSTLMNPTVLSYYVSEGWQVE